jgi:hypothetical protein
VKAKCKPKKNYQDNKKKKATLAEIRAIAKRFRKHMRGPIQDHGEMLYDERGLPK